MSKKIKKVVLPVGALTLVGAIGALTASQLAYLTDEETALNTFTVGDVKVDVKEPNYPGNNSDEVSHVIPNQEIAKDPQMENTGTDDAVVFAQFSIPVANITLVDVDGTKQDKAYTSLFDTIVSTKGEDGTYTVDENGKTLLVAEKTGTNGSYISSAWTQIGTEKYVDSEGNVVLYKNLDDGKYYTADGTTVIQKADGSGDATSLNEIAEDTLKNIAKVVYTVGYNTVLAKDTKTDAIFDQVKLVNFIDGEGLENKDMTVGIVGMAIQADNLGADVTLPDSTNATESTDDDTFSKATLETIYNKYFNQNVKKTDTDTKDNKIVNESDDANDADVTNQYNIKGTEIIKSSFDLTDAFTSTALTVGKPATATITLNTTKNGVADTDENEIDVLSTVKAYRVTTENVDGEDKTVETPMSDEDISVSYVRKDANTYEITVVPRKATAAGESITLRFASTQGLKEANNSITGFTVSEPTESSSGSGVNTEGSSTDDLGGTDESVGA